MYLRLILLAVLLALPSASLAANVLTFGWDYDEEAVQHITGFRLYQDGLPIAEVDRDARAISVRQVEDYAKHNYHLTAFSPVEESGPSTTITVPEYLKKVSKIVEGSFLLKITEDDGTVELTPLLNQ